MLLDEKELTSARACVGTAKIATATQAIYATIIVNRPLLLPRNASTPTEPTRRCFEDFRPSVRNGKLYGWSRSLSSVGVRVCSLIRIFGGSLATYVFNCPGCLLIAGTSSHQSRSTDVFALRVSLDNRQDFLYAKFLTRNQIPIPAPASSNRTTKQTRATINLNLRYRFLSGGARELCGKYGGGVYVAIS